MTVTIVEGDLSSDIAQAMRASGRVAVDTETTGLDWSKDRLQLCQLFTPATGAVFVRRVVQQSAPHLREIFEDPDTIKIFHHAPFDLKFLEAQWGLRAASVSCTKAASKLVSPGIPKSEHSLQPLLRRLLGVEIVKGAVRTSDWGSDYLTDEQVVYAARDVLYLLDLHTVLTEQLAEAGRGELFEQVCSYMPVDAHLAVAGYPNPLIY